MYEKLNVVFYSDVIYLSELIENYFSCTMTLRGDTTYLYIILKL